MSEPAIGLATYADYLALERSSEVKHEFVDGIILAMGGGTMVHALLGAAVAGELRSLFAGTGCRVHSGDQRVRIPASGRAFYADVTLTCGPLVPHPEDPDALADATVLVEVLSPTTERHDRTMKLAEYRTLPSVQAVLFVHCDQPVVHRWGPGPAPTAAQALGIEADLPALLAAFDAAHAVGRRPGRGPLVVRKSDRRLSGDRLASPFWPSYDLRAQGVLGMNKTYLIPIASTLLTACGPAYVGDWELGSMSWYSEPTGTASGDLTLEKEEADLSVNFTDSYGDSYSIAVDGDADDKGDGEVELDLSGTLTDFAGDSYSIQLQADCEADGDDLECSGNVLWDGDSYSFIMDFKAD